MAPEVGYPPAKCVVPGSVNDVVSLDGGKLALVEQLTKLRSLRTREGIVTKGDGTGALGRAAAMRSMRSMVGRE